MSEYNNALPKASPSVFGLVANINGIKKRDVGPVTPDPGDKSRTLVTKKPTPETKRPIHTRTSIGQVGGKPLTEHQSELNAVVVGASVLVLSSFALRCIIS